MKYFIVAILLSTCLFSMGQAARIFEEPVNNNTGKRFISQIWDAIQDNIIRPIQQHVIDPIVSGVNVGIDAIVDGTNTAINGKYFSSF
jgi:hypothetical protein